jgi:hypothetical protein
MRMLSTGICAAAVLWGISLAQQATPATPTNSTAPQGQQSSSTTKSTAASQPASVPASGATRIAPGSVIPVQLTKSVDAKKVKTGDEVDAKVTQDLKADNGEVIVPKDTKVIGHVTEAQARTKDQKESQVGIAFDHAVMKNGGDVPLPMSIQAIIAPSNLNNDNNNNRGGDQPVSEPNVGRGTPSYGAGRSSGPGAGSSPQTPSYPTSSDDRPSSGQSGTNAHQPITANTQGVVGMSDLKLSTGANASQGSLVSSEKSNVKLESGTLMLLRVNP